MPDSKKNSESNQAKMHNRRSAFRVLDANANRATEGLRVVEEFLRFHWQDRFLTETCKSIRHEVSRTVVRLMSVGNAPHAARRRRTLAFRCKVKQSIRGQVLLMWRSQM